jgi:hypothetical protein
MSLTESIKTTVYCSGCTRLQSEVTALKTGWQIEILKNADQILTIERLNAALTTANADYAAVVLANQQTNAELAAAKAEATAAKIKCEELQDEMAHRWMPENGRLRVLCEKAREPARANRLRFRSSTDALTYCAKHSLRYESLLGKSSGCPWCNLEQEQFVSGRLLKDLAAAKAEVIRLTLQRDEREKDRRGECRDHATEQRWADKNEADGVPYGTF